MPAADQIACCYAEALLSFARAANRLDQVSEDIATVVSLVSQNEEMRRFLADPHVKPEGKEAALRDLLVDKISPLTLKLMLAIQEQDFIARIDQVAERFYENTARLRESSTGEIVTARELPAEMVKEIEQEASRVLNQQVSLRVRVDPSLLGGVSLRVGNFVLDGTVEHQLEEFRKTLLS